MSSRRTLRDLADLLRDGPPLSTTELAQIVGLSPSFIRAEIRTGHLCAIRVGHGRKQVYRIAVYHARAYVHALGLLRSAS